MRVALSATSTQATTVALSATPAGIVQVPSQVVLAAGQTVASFPVTALAAGQAEVVAQVEVDEHGIAGRLLALLHGPLGDTFEGQTTTAIRLDTPATPERVLAAILAP